MSFAEKNKDISILTELHINHDQIHHQIYITNNYLGPIFFSPGDSHTKESLVLLHQDLEGISEVDTDPKRGFVSFKVIPVLLIIELSVFIPLQGIEPGNSWLEGVSLKEYKIIWKIKKKRNEKKIKLGGFN